MSLLVIIPLYTSHSVSFPTASVGVHIACLPSTVSNPAPGLLHSCAQHPSTELAKDRGWMTRPTQVIPSAGLFSCSTGADVFWWNRWENQISTHLVSTPIGPAVCLSSCLLCLYFSNLAFLDLVPLVRAIYHGPRASAYPCCKPFLLLY